MPARTDPVMLTIDGVSWTTIERPVSRSPQMTLSTPFGRNSAAISASRVAEAGVVSLGFRTTELPAAIAAANFHTAIIIG